MFAKNGPQIYIVTRGNIQTILQKNLYNLKIFILIEIIEYNELNAKQFFYQ